MLPQNNNTSMHSINYKVRLMGLPTILLTFNPFTAAGIREHYLHLIINAIRAHRDQSCLQLMQFSCFI